MAKNNAFLNRKPSPNFQNQTGPSVKIPNVTWFSGESGPEISVSIKTIYSHIIDRQLFPVRVQQLISIITV
ncbi:unnamed protein product, partial [Larinioides sclopetarius]